MSLWLKGLIAVAAIVVIDSLVFVYGGEKLKSGEPTVHVKPVVSERTGK